MVSLVSLGCAKNTVDSECILGHLIGSGLLIAEDPADADVCLVNTCGFIDEARAEAASVLAELGTLKRRGRLKAVVALGCLVERIADCPELDPFLKQADARVSFGDYPRLADTCRALFRGAAVQAPGRSFQLGSARQTLPADFMQFLKSPRARIASPHSAYLKISEGCSNLCRFCSIPQIKGLQVSRPIEDLLAEARSLAETGAREINLIAQDTTSYGRDLYGSIQLPQLLRRLKEVDSSIWFRLLYGYPRFLTGELLDLLASEPHLCPYADLPLQHISDPILKAMGRGMTKKETMDLLDLIARKLPDGALRTTFIVGYPGETEAEFRELLALVREGRFTHMGVFTYSREPRTPAARLSDELPQEEKDRRRDELMLAQLEVSRHRLKQRVGRDVEVMWEGPAGSGDEVPEGATAVARSRLEAPEVDGLIYLRDPDSASRVPGDRLTVCVTESLDYDLIAEA